MTNINSPFELDENFFQRKQFYGWDFSWYAVDSIGSIGQFTSGYAAIPERIFYDKAEYVKIDDYFQNLPFVTKSSLSRKFENIKHLSPNVFATPLKDATRGLYVFEEKLDRSNYYELCAIPDDELKIEKLPKEIQDYLSSFTIETIQFNKTIELSILGFFECDISRQNCK